MAAQQGLSAHLVHHAMSDDLDYLAGHLNVLATVGILRHRPVRPQGIAGLLISTRVGGVHRLQRPYQRALVAEHHVG